MNQTLTQLKGELDNSLILGNSNNSPSIMDRTRHKINKETEDLNNTCITRRNRHIQNTPLHNKRMYIFSNVHGTYPQIDHVLGHKTCLNKLSKS